MAALPASFANGLGGPSPAQLAKDGNIAAIMAFSDQNPKGEGDAKAYKWLVVARDYGYRRADTAMADLLEISSLRYDDDSLVVSQIHYELGLAYLTGSDGLPKDFKKAQRNLRASLPGIYDVTVDIASDREQLAGEARAVFDSVFPPRRARRRLK
jgi:hypothetical protein